MNKSLQTVIVIPLTTSFKNWPTRVDILVQIINSQACIEHIRSISKKRFVEKIGVVSDIEMADIRKHLNAVFVE